jgi:hypothetical protein
VVGAGTVFGVVDNVGSVAVERLHVCWHWCRELLDVACRRRDRVQGRHRLTLGHGRLYSTSSQLLRKVMLVGSICRMAGCRVVSRV